MDEFAKEVETEVEEVSSWIDHSNATAIEHFVASLEALFVKWGLGLVAREKEVEEQVEKDGFVVEEIKFGKDLYSAMYVSTVSQNLNLEKGEVLSPIEMGMLRANDRFESQNDGIAPLELLFGVESFIILNSSMRKATPNDVALLLSSALLALPACSNPVPCFVPYIGSAVSPQSPERLSSRLKASFQSVAPGFRKKGTCYKGVWVCSQDSSGTTIEFASMREKLEFIPSELSTIQGLLRFFLKRLGEGNENVEMDSSALFQYTDLEVSRMHPLLASATEEAISRSKTWSEWPDMNLGWRLHVERQAQPPVIEALQGGQSMPPLWGPLRDPVSGVSLACIWPCFQTKLATCEDLLAGKAPRWTIEVQQPEHEEESSGLNHLNTGESAMSCPLAWSCRYVFEMLEAAKTDEFRNALMINLPDTFYNAPTMNPDMVVNKNLESQKIDSLVRALFETKADLSKPSGYRRRFCGAIKEACEECWLCSKASISRNDLEIAQQPSRLAPQGSILCSLAVRVVPEFGASMGALSAVWRAFVSEVRHCWDSARHIPIERISRKYFDVVRHSESLLQQKLALLNVCISIKAHKLFNHRWTQKDSADRDNDDAEFFEVSSSGIDNPWTVENSLMTEDMVRERVELMTSLAMQQETSALHEGMLLSSVASEMKAFKACNRKAGFDDFKRWKGRARVLGDYWRDIWDSSKPQSVADQLMEDSNVFDFEREAEKILHFLETVSPQHALTELLLLSLMSSIDVLNDPIESFHPKYPSIHKLLVCSLRVAQAHFRRLNFAKAICLSPRKHNVLDEEGQVEKTIRQAAMDAIERSEFLITMAASLTQKFPESVVAQMLAAEAESGSFVATLDTGMEDERRHIHSILFPNTDMPEPIRKDLLFKCLAHRPAFQGGKVRAGANRLFASILKGNEITIATSLTETAF